jgi:hypothetical protein
MVDAAVDAESRLRETLVWKPGVERLMNDDHRAVLQSVRDRRPRLLILDGRRPETPALIRRIREQDDVRHISIAALLDGTAASAAREQALRLAGANVVLSEWQSTPVWDEAFQKLLEAPPRRWITAGVSVTVGATPVPGGERLLGTARNVSTRGILIETRQRLAVDTVVHLHFRLGDDARGLHVVGRVVWAQAGDDGTLRQGIEFAGFYEDALDRIAAFASARTASAA